MTPERRTELVEVYRSGLLDDTLPFWLEHGPDPEHGGVFTCLDRDGLLLDDDKAVWAQGRFAWLMATLYETVEPRDEWLEAALSCLDFLNRHAIDSDGRLFFLLTRDGRPLRRRRYAYSEAFAAMAFAALARASGQEEPAACSVAFFERFADVMLSPGGAQPKVDPRTRPMHALGPWMIALNVVQTMRETIDWEPAGEWIDRCIETIERLFVRTDRQAVLEVVGKGGEVLDHFEGRMLNPGHAIEAAWFILHEARLRSDAALTGLGCRMLDWMWHRGWDSEHGGLFYFRDLEGKPVQEYWHDMKFWWPHCETVIATLLAHELTGDARYLEWHRQVHDWSHAHFADPSHGEWFGYLHRDGRLSVSLKGNHWKGPFHLPRMQWYCWRLLSRELNDGGD